MSDGTHIEWTDATWNPITGCSVVSPGCTNCYAMKLAGTRLRDHPSRKGLTRDSRAGPVWTGEVRFNADWLDQPLRWARPRRIFVCAHADLFHEAVPDEWIDQIFAVMALAPQHQFQVLTKRSKRMRDYMEGRAGKLARHMIDAYVLGQLEAALTPRRAAGTWPVVSIGDVDMPDDVTMAVWPLPNVWLGVSVEDQARADQRIPDLLATPAAVRWVSAEPLLGPVDLGAIQAPRYSPEDHLMDWKFSALETGDYYFFHSGDFTEGGDGPDREHQIDWVVAGGESGPGARPMHPEWARLLRDQCADAGVPFLFKQWGDWAPGENATSTVGKPVKVATWFDEAWEYDQLTAASADAQTIEDEPTVYRVGKKAAGRLLDGVLHDAFPAERR